MEIWILFDFVSLIRSRLQKLDYEEIEGEYLQGTEATEVTGGETRNRENWFYLNMKKIS